MPPEIVRDLSTDQHYGYQMVCAVRSGNIPIELANLEIGPLCHSRWLTTANRFLRLWASKHRLSGVNLVHLTWIVEFIVVVYFPCWLMIKARPSWIDGPRHLLHHSRKEKKY